MKEWRAPELIELEVGKTESTFHFGSDLDGGTWETCYGNEMPAYSDGCWPIEK